MIKGKLLYNTQIKDYKSIGTDVEFGVYGLFNTEKVLWRFFIISYIGKKLTPDICVYEQNMDYENILKSGKEVKTKEEGIKFIQEYKDKWEYGSNDTRQEKRDQKIKDVLGN